jgi:hypothetical protein
VRFRAWTGSAWGIEVVDGTAQAAGLAMDFDDAGQPIVSYHDGAGGVVFARHNAAGWDVQTIFPALASRARRAWRISRAPPGSRA